MTFRLHHPSISLHAIGSFMFVYVYVGLCACGRRVLGFCAHWLLRGLRRLILGPTDGPRQVLRPVLRAALGGAVVVGFGYGFINIGYRQALARTSMPSLEAGWEEVHRPLQLYGLAGAQFGPLLSYQASRHSKGGGRQDFLTFGQFHHEQERYLRIAFYRPMAEPRVPFDFVKAMVRHAAQSALAVARLDQPNEVMSRFGALEVADISLYAQGHRRNCLAFRLGQSDGAVELAGFACGAGPVMDRLGLVCAVERLELLAAGDDDELVGFFTRAESRRSAFCETKKGVGQIKTPWLDASAPIPPLRSERGLIKVMP